MTGVVYNEPQSHGDDRGRFVEIARFGAYPQSFAQSNHSRSRGGVLRGLHYHRRQADLWYVVSGRAQVALADLRLRTDPPRVATFVLDGNRPATLYIPQGIAHGFLALSDVDLVYWVTAEYDAADEFGIAWDDPALSVPWDTTAPVLSRRDQSNPGLRWEDIPRFS